MNSEKTHSEVMHNLIRIYKEASSEEERERLVNEMRREISFHDETLASLSDEEYTAQDGDAIADAIVNQWLVAQGARDY